MEENKNIEPAIDPSILTTQQLWREVGSLEKYLLSKIAQLEKNMDGAHEDLVRVPTDVQKQVGALKELLEKTIYDLKELLISRLDDEHKLKEEKFEKVYQKFASLETTRVEQKNDTAANVASALLAAKEAVNKSEVATMRQMGQIEARMQANEKANDGVIADIKERLTKIEGIAVGVLNAKNQQKDSGSYNIAIISAIIAAVAIIVTIIIAVMLSK